MLSRPYIILPARLASTRFPGKLLSPVGDKSLIQCSWERYRSIPCVSIFIATPDDTIASVGKEFGASILRTEPASCGTETVVKAAGLLPEYCCGKIKRVFANVQAEWPNINTEDIKKAIKYCLKFDAPHVVSLYYKDSPDINRNRVKVVLNKEGEAVYFSRAIIPYESKICCYHIGVYVYNDAFVKNYYDMVEPSCVSEDLEQLKWVYNKIPISMMESERAIGIDSPENLKSYVESIIPCSSRPTEE